MTDKTRTDCGAFAVCPTCHAGVPDSLSHDAEVTCAAAKKHVRETGHSVAVIPCNIVSKGDPDK